ncbi:MAG: cytosine methyltransferase [Flavobacteriaceae bacterium]|nr:cytosine methyltransferase [Flavobacteriaceae bacterium]|tara:strand:- start:587 stop:955 length:369 start_codon:yes stop_codon:yes gene_type:complete
MRSKNRVHNKPELRKFRKELRQNLTPAEAFLWKHLKNGQFEGRKFRRQHSIENFIVDFYCASEKLVIELDGQVHFNEESQIYDKARQEQIESLGFTVIRFENKMVFDLLPSVLLEIKGNFKK